MPTIEHAALWTPDLERARRFYTQYFGGSAGPKYTNEQKQFTSYFLRFDSGARLELMHTPAIAEALVDEDHKPKGYAHLAFAVGSEKAVVEHTERLRGDGYKVASETRWTGDGYYESVILDPDGNRVEITV